MAHMLETMAYAGAKPWHGLGKADWNGSIKDAGLDWRVERRPIYVDMPDGSKKLYADDAALVRSCPGEEGDGDILSIVGRDWNEVQNQVAFDFFSEYVEAAQMTMQTAGSIKGGRHVWVLAKMRETERYNLFGRDDAPTEQYCLFSNPHEYGKNVRVQFTNTEVVCNNTLTYALREMSGTNSNHRLVFNPDIVKRDLGLIEKRAWDHKATLEFLASKSYKDYELKEFFNKVFPAQSKKVAEEGADNLSRNAKRALEVLETMPTIDPYRHTYYGAFNAVTFLTNHELGHNRETAFASLTSGPNATRNLQALNLAVQMAQAA